MSPQKGTILKGTFIWTNHQFSWWYSLVQPPNHPGPNNQTGYEMKTYSLGPGIQVTRFTPPAKWVHLATSWGSPACDFFCSLHRSSHKCSEPLQCPGSILIKGEVPGGESSLKADGLKLEWTIWSIYIYICIQWVRQIYKWNIHNIHRLYAIYFGFAPCFCQNFEHVRHVEESWDSISVAWKGGFNTLWNGITECGEVSFGGQKTWFSQLHLEGYRGPKPNHFPIWRVGKTPHKPFEMCS